MNYVRQFITTKLVDYQGLKIAINNKLQVPSRLSLKKGILRESRKKKADMNTDHSFVST